MRINILQRIEVFFLLSVVRIIYFIDIAMGAVFELFLKSTTGIVAFSFVLFLIYSIKTSYIENIIAAYIDTSTETRIINNTVLGSSTYKKDVPVLTRKVDFPELTAKAVLIVDKSNKKTLYEKNSNLKLASASTTKLITALVALDIYSLNEEISIPQICADEESTKADLPVDTKYRVESLLNAMLVSSAGDAACALARGKIGYDEFIYRMNQKAYQLKMSASYFTNPIGLDGLNSSHFSTAKDLYKLAESAMNSSIIRQIVSKKEYTIKSVDETSGSPTYIGKLDATNKLLFEIPQTIGVKTGTTAEAGQVLIYEYKDELKDLVIVIMGSEDRFSEVRALLNWVLVSYEWK